MVDADGVSLVAIQALNAKLEEREANRKEREAALQQQIEERDVKI